MVENNNTPATEFGAPAPYAEGAQPVNPYPEPAAPTAGVYAPETVTTEAVTLDAGDLLAELEAEARRGLDQVVMIAVPSRPGWALAASTFITQAELKNWQMRSRRGGSKKNTKPEDVDAVKNAALMLLEKNEGIYRQQPSGELAQVLDGEGDALTLTSDEFLALFPDHRRDAVAALRAFAGDGAVVSMGATLVERAGWSEQADVIEDPTNG